MSEKTTVKKNKKIAKEEQKFVTDAKKGKYGPIETSSIVYTRMPEKAQPFVEGDPQSITYYGIR